MIIIACVEDNMGMMFSGRRVSRDSAVTERILSLCGDKRLLMNSSSAELFGKQKNISISDDFLNEAESGEYCFIESSDISSFDADVEKIILFHWNRRYPSDLKFEFPEKNGKWRLDDSVDFEGTSHKKITQEIYIDEVKKFGYSIVNIALYASFRLRDTV